MNKGLKALYSIKTNMQHLNGGVVGDYNPDAWDIIEKSLKALEIIKDKKVNVFILLHSGDLETYNDMVEDNRKLTLEQYGHLIEVFDND